ncbi:PAS domain-containing sensor histidine kinase [Gemmatimonadota bacterium]
MTEHDMEEESLRPGLRSALRRIRLVWKVNGLILVILAVVLGILGYLGTKSLERAEIDMARDISIVSSGRIITRLEETMMGHEVGELPNLVNRMASENPAYRDIRLIAHEGRVVATQIPSGTLTVTQDLWPCIICHLPDGQNPEITTDTCCEVLEYDNQERALSVVTPIFLEEGCSSESCHPGLPAGSVLGILQADFSLARVDNLTAQLNRNTALAILISLIVGMAITWMMTERLLGRRIRMLREGAMRLAEKDFSFRFGDTTGDGLSEIFGVFDDMTSELSDTLSELMDTKEYLQSIVENSADLIITVGPDGLIKTFNVGAELALGYRREEVIGKSIEMLFADPRDRAKAIEQMRSGDHVVNYMTRFVTKDGEIRRVMNTLSRLRAADGTPIGTMGISKDITEELRLQVQLLRSKRLAALGQALTGIQHSIKNMLNVMKGGSYMVKLGLAKEDMPLVTEGWEMVRKGIDDMTDMSMSMLDFAKTRQLKLKPVDLAELVAKVHELSRIRLADLGIGIELEVAPDLPRVICDSEGIQSVIMDLLSNAMDACAWKDYPENERPLLVLRALRAEQDGRIEIQVEDNGEGMPEEVKERIFLPFFSTKEKKGTGMGLAVVNRIVEAHEGETIVESVPGEGTTFSVSLPIKGPSLTEEHH